MSSARVVTQDEFKKICQRLITAAKDLKGKTEQEEDDFFALTNPRWSGLSDSCNNQEALNVTYLNETPLKYLARTRQIDAVNFILRKRNLLAEFINLEDAVDGLIVNGDYVTVAMLVNELDEKVKAIANSKEGLNLENRWRTDDILEERNDLLFVMKESINALNRADGFDQDKFTHSMMKFFAAITESRTREYILNTTARSPFLIRFVSILNERDAIKTKFPAHPSTAEKVRILDHFVNFYTHFVGKDIQQAVKAWVAAFKAENNDQNPFVTLHRNRRTGLTSVFDHGESASVGIFRNILKKYPKDDELDAIMAKPLAPKPETNNNLGFAKKWFGLGMI